MSAFTEPLAQVRKAIKVWEDGSRARLLGVWAAYAETDLIMSAEALAALAQVERLATDMETALERIAEQQPKTLDLLRAHGIIFDGPLGTDPDNWENVAFSIYSDLCETDSIARAGLSAREEGTA